MILQIAVEIGLGLRLVPSPEFTPARTAKPDAPEASGSKDLGDVSLPHVPLELVEKLRGNLERDFVQDHLARQSNVM